MQVETYEEKEITHGDSISELTQQGEYQLLVEQLDLTGQRTLTLGGTKPHAYRKITVEEKFVFETLFPIKTPLKDYADSVVPLRVLKVAAHVTSLHVNELSYLEVWHPQKGVDDPVLVARPERFSSEIFILARWGNALLPYDELLSLACKKASDAFHLKLIEAKNKIDSVLNDKTYYETQITIGRIPDFYISL